MWCVLRPTAICLLGCAALLGAPAAAAAPSYWDGVVAHWTFDDGTGKDSAGANDLTLVGSPAMVPSPGGKAMQTRASAYAVADAATLNVTGWTGLTISVWIKPVHWNGGSYGGAPGFTPYGHMLSRGNDANRGTYGFRAGAAPAYAPPAFGVNFGPTQSAFTLFQKFNPAKPPYPETGKWYHLVGTYDGQFVRTFVNGEPDDRTAVEVPNLPLWEAAKCRTYIGTVYELPMRHWGDAFFSGEYDDVAIWKRALSPAEVARFYRDGPPEAADAPVDALAKGLIACWRFDGDGRDSAGTSDATLVGAVSFTASPMGEALNVTDGSTYARIDAPGIDANGWTGLTVSVWFRPQRYTTYCNVVSRGRDTPNAPGGYGICLQPSGANDAVFYVMNTTNASVGAQFGSFRVSSKPPAGNWYHLVGTYDGQFVRCYFNGEPDGQKQLEAPGGPVYDQPGYKTYIGTTYDLPFRQWSDMCCPGAYDEVRLYNRALTPAEVAKLFQANTRRGAFIATMPRREPTPPRVTPPTPQPAPPPPRDTTPKLVGYSYDEKTSRGVLSVDIGNSGIEARDWVIRNIGKIASSKELLLEAGSEPTSGGRYKVHNESFKNGIMTVEFEVLH